MRSANQQPEATLGLQGSTLQRLQLVDTVRGAAIAGVVLFHLVWDLEFTGFVSGIAFHPVWLAFGRVLAGTFMFLVGVSLVLAHRRHFCARAYSRRIGTIAAAAVVISLVTFAFFPGVFVYYGILHAIAVASLVCFAFVRLPAILSLIAGAVSLVLPFLISSPLLDSRWLAWIGLAANPPPSNDFVPLFPWVGLTLLGVALAKYIGLDQRENMLQRYEQSQHSSTALAWMGRHSLAIYLIHQPVLLSIIVPVSRFL